MRLFIRFFSALGPLQLALLLGASAAGSESLPSNGASTLVVTSTADSGAGSLRQALADANNGDTIQFDAALNGQRITLTSEELVIAKDITISGPGPNLLTVSGGSNASRPTMGNLAATRPNMLAVWRTPEGDNFRIFHVMPGHTVVIAGLTLSGAFFGDVGGGIFNEKATLTVNHCIVQQNTAYSGAGIYNDGATAALTITDSNVTGNLTNGGQCAGIVNELGTLMIINSTVSENIAGIGTFTKGGGILNGGTMEIRESAISRNFAGIQGGGISNSGMLTIIDSTVDGNHAGTSLSGSGIGGGILNGGTLVIRNSTISDNEALSGKGGTGFGGGILSSGPLTIVNSTISGNFARRDGGGIWNGGPLTLTNSTVSGNEAATGGGIFISGNNAVLEIGNTILETGASGPNIFNNGGTVTSHGYNVSSDNGGGLLTAAGDQINTSPMLGPLQNNGGPTFTHAPFPGSPVINTGDPNFTPPPDTDQRGYARVFNGRIDIGSLEVQPTPTPGPTPTATPASTPTVTATPSPTPTPTATPTTTPSPTATPSSSPAQALNISTRLRVELGDNVMIGGFIISGTQSKKIALRGIGPSLASSGISDVLADPTLELRDSSGALLFQNDDWQDDPKQAAQLTALGLAPQDAKESGIVTTVQPGAYTVIMQGTNGGTGVGLVEVYDADPAASSQLANISTRGFVQTGDNVMIGGFILGGSSSNTSVAVRGIGPSLNQSGLNNALADPALELRDSNGMLLIANDNWQDDAASAAQLTAHGLAPQDLLESGIFTSLPPGAFTAILAGNNSGTGIGLVEIYDVR